MKVIACAILLVASALAQPTQDFRTLFDCYGKDDGNYPSHGACSTAYVTCEAGHREHRHCPAGLRYHSDLDKCLSEVKTPGCAAFSSEENLCLGRPTGFYGVDGDCTAFVFCAHEIMTRMTCGDGLHYNPLRLRCEDPASFPGTCGDREPSPAFDCHHRAAGKYASHDDCTTFFVCDYDRSAWTYKCTHGSAFNGEGCAPIGSVEGCLPQRKAGAEETCANGDGVFGDSCSRATLCWDGYGWDIGCGGESPYWSDFIQGCGIVAGEDCDHPNADHEGTIEPHNHAYNYHY